MTRFFDLYELFIRDRGSKLICRSNHRTPKYKNLEPNHLTVVINGVSHNVLYETENSKGHFSIEMIYEFIEKGCPLQVEFSFEYKEESIKGFIHFNDDIPQNLPYSRNFYHQIKPLNFTVNIFDVEWVDIRFAKQSDMSSCLIAALGFFKYHNFIQPFIRMVNFLPEYRITVLWEKFIYSLSNTGYFDIFDINHFQSIVLMTFFNMFKIFKHTFLNKMVLKNLFLSFVQQLLSNNCWFIIVGDKYRPIRGRPSSSLINFFSCRDSPPFAEMVYDELIQGQSELFPYLLKLSGDEDDEE